LEDDVVEDRIDATLKAALKEYFNAVKGGGWEAGEPIIAKHTDIPDFDKWCLAVRLMLRADELLHQHGLDDGGAAG